MRGFKEGEGDRKRRRDVKLKIIKGRGINGKAAGQMDKQIGLCGLNGKRKSSVIQLIAILVNQFSAASVASQAMCVRFPAPNSCLVHPLACCLSGS